MTGRISCHVHAHAFDGASPWLSAIAQLGHEGGVVHSVSAKPAFTQLVRSAERLNVSDQVVHNHDMRRIYPSRQGQTDGFIRKLSAHNGLCDMHSVTEQKIDIELIRRVLRDATSGKSAEYSQRSLDTAAGVGRGTVNDILSGKNSNPTVSVLAPLATALGGDVSMFGIAVRPIVLPSGQKLVETMEVLLDSVGLDNLSGEYAEKLAQQLPGILEDSSVVAEPAKMGGKPRRGAPGRQHPKPDLGTSS